MDNSFLCNRTTLFKKASYLISIEDENADEANDEIEALRDEVQQLKQTIVTKESYEKDIQDIKESLAAIGNSLKISGSISLS